MRDIKRVLAVVAMTGLLVCMLVGCSGQARTGSSQSASSQTSAASVSQSSSEAQGEVTSSEVVKLAKDILGGKDQGNEKVTNYYSPDVKKVKKLPSTNSMEMATDNYEKSAPYWRVSFETNKSATLGDIVYYFDNEGTYIGSPYRD
ncbi:MAG: hypothetical protein ACOX69_09155 [Coriobacteriales bacterium]|jgi:hypothetical protein